MIDDRARDLLTRTVLGEAAAEPDAGQRAVAAVVMNRLRSGQYGDSIPKVVLAKAQFEPWGTQEGRSRMYRYARDGADYQRAAANVEAALNGDDPTSGAINFFAPAAQAALGRQPPKWANGQEPLVIGRHNFYGGKTTTNLPAGFELIDAPKPLPAAPAAAADGAALPVAA